MLRRLRCQNGQTSVEYALCIVFAFFLALTFYILIDNTGEYREMLGMESGTANERSNLFEGMYHEYEYGITRPFP